MHQATRFEKEIFADALEASWTEKTRRGWTALTSFGIQTLFVALLLILPLLLRATGLPSFYKLSTPVSLGQPFTETPAIGSHVGSSAVSIVSSDKVRMPTHIPAGIPTATYDGPPIIATSGDYLEEADGHGSPHGLPNLFESGPRPMAPAPPPPITHTVRLSHISEGNIIRKVLPTYPYLGQGSPY